MTDYKLSAEGFILPDFDFDSNDAVIPVSSPAFDPPKFDIFEIYLDIREMIDKNEFQNLSEILLIFRAAIIHINDSDPESFPQELITSYNVPETLMSLIDPKKHPEILYESIITAIAWTGAHAEESQYFANPDFINFLIESSIISLSDPQFTGDKRIGKASFGLLRNLLYNSNDIRIYFIKNRGVELFSTLYFELTNESINHCILWILHNSLLVEPTPPIEYYAPIENLFKISFRNQMKGVAALEIGLAIVYVKMSPEFASSFIDNVKFEIVTSSIEYAHPDTQLAILDLLEILALYPNDNPENKVASDVFERIKWKEINQKIPAIGDPALNKKLIKIASHFFEVNYKHAIDTHIVGALIDIYSTSKYSIKCRVLDCLQYLMNDPIINDGINSILFQRVISKLIPFFCDTDRKIINFAAQFLMRIIEYAENNPKYQHDVLEQMDEEEMAPILDDLLNEEIPQELAELISVLKIRYENLSDAYDQMEMTNAENEEEEEDEKSIPMFINYQALSQNHQSTPKEFDDSIESDYDEEEVEWEDVVID